MAMVHQAHRLVMHETIHIALLGNIFHAFFLAPTWPMVTAENQFGAIAVKVNRVVQMLDPNQRITGFRAA